MEDGKESLNLTVRASFKRRAAELAKLRRRSISGLFEDLVDEEEARISVSPTAPPMKNKPVTPLRKNQTLRHKYVAGIFTAFGLSTNICVSFLGC